jgi:hypothetical protein
MKSNSDHVDDDDDNDDVDEDDDSWLSKRSRMFVHTSTSILLYFDHDSTSIRSQLKQELADKAEKEQSDKAKADKKEEEQNSKAEPAENDVAPFKVGDMVRTIAGKSKDRFHDMLAEVQAVKKKRLSCEDTRRPGRGHDEGLSVQNVGAGRHHR